MTSNGSSTLPERLGHLVLGARLVLHQQEAVDEDLARELDVRRHQHRGPEDRVELEDVLADDVERRPERVRQVLALAREGQGRVVVQERVEPDVEDVALVPRHLDAPGQLGAAERDVVEAAVDERQRLVVAGARRHEVRPLGVQRLEALLEGRELEEPVLLALGLERDLVDRARLVGPDLAARS